MEKQTFASFGSCFCFAVVVFPLLVSSECTCGGDGGWGDSAGPSDFDRDKGKAVQLKVVAIFSILAASAVGVSLPILGKKVQSLRPENDMFFMIKAFAAGVILATGFVHILPDAFGSMGDLRRAPWVDFPFAGFVAMLSATLTMMVDTFATSYYKKMHFHGEEAAAAGLPVVKEEGGGGHVHGVVVVPEDHVHVHTHASHGHAHGSSFVSDDVFSAELLRHRVISQVLELGIVIHSVIIGISLGASYSPRTIKPLVAALTFHQFFEGMGLGGCITEAKFKSKAIATMILFFSLTTPAGIGIGIGISSIYNENGPTALIVEGIFNAASAGILIYMALVDLLAADFMNPRMQTNLRLQLGANISLLLGSGSMSLLAKWA